MVISVEEVMESVHFYGVQDLPPESLQPVNMLIFLFPFSPTCSSEECALKERLKRAGAFLDIIERRQEKSQSKCIG